MKTRAEILTEARDYLVEGHWIKGAMADGAGNHCAAGAVTRISGGYYPMHMREEVVAEHVAALQILHELAEEQYPDRMWHDELTPIAQFNDHDDTTLEEVVALFDKAITRAEEVI